MCDYPFFIPQVVLFANSSLFWFKVTNEHREFRNYLPKLTYLLCLDTVASSLCFLFRNPLHYYKPLCPYDCISTLYLAVRPLGTLP